MISVKRDLYRVAKAVGLTVRSINVTGGKHFKVILERDDGETLMYFTASSPSDRTGIRNLTADWKRFARNSTKGESNDQPV